VYEIRDLIKIWTVWN